MRRDRSREIPRVTDKRARRRKETFKTFQGVDLLQFTKPDHKWNWANLRGTHSVDSSSKCLGRVNAEEADSSPPANKSVAFLSTGK